MSQAVFYRRFLLRILTLAMLPLLAACDQVGLSGRDAEWARQKAGSFYVVKASHEGAVVAAKGRQVAVEPATGFCLADDSIETSSRSIFMLIGDCAVEAPPGDSRGSRGELQLPKSIPSIMTVSISGDPGFRSDDGSYDKLKEFLKSPEGKAMLGRSGSGAGVTIKESREVDGALLLYLEDTSPDLVPILSSSFWRAFVELNDRLTVVTISGFRDRPLGRETMLAYLISQVQTLGAANETPLGPPETMLARSDTTAPARTDPDAATGGEEGTRRLSEVRAEAAATTATTTGTATAGTPAPAAEAPKDEVKVAEAPKPVADIPRGNSRIERIMLVPRARPGARAPSPIQVTERPVTTSAPVPLSTVATGVTTPAPAARSAAPAIPATRPAGDASEPKPPAVAAPEPAATRGPPTEYAPRTAPVAPKRRPG